MKKKLKVIFIKLKYSMYYYLVFKKSVKTSTHNNMGIRFWQLELKTNVSSFFV